MTYIYTSILAMALLLNGCSGFMMQTNRESTITESISPSVYKVAYCGAGYMPKAEAETFAMRSASGLVLRKGYTHFVILQKSDKSETCQLQDVPRNIYQQNLKQSSTESLAGPKTLRGPI